MACTGGGDEHRIGRTSAAVVRHGDDIRGDLLRMQIDQRAFDAPADKTQLLEEWAPGLASLDYERLLDRDADYGDIEIADPGNDPESETLHCDAAGRLGICMEQLRDQHRQCIAMIYWDGVTYQQLADKLNTPTGTVKVWVRRGLEKLRQCLEQ